jgi:tRNA-dihydrouridine synthase A
MMDWTDRAFRRMMRRITRRTLLYTEMVTTGALLHGDVDRHLARGPEESPVALQLGGDDPEALAHAARLAEAYGYDEVNLNVGCPSDRVQRGRFGACLMAEPWVVADAVAALRDATTLPVTVKHRIGIDDLDRYQDLLRFVDVVAEAGADRFTVHARKAWLQGLSPKQNRTVPPLRHEEVHRLAAERPDLVIETNGGIRDLDAAAAQLAHVDAVMIGRAAYEAPMTFATADRRFFGGTDPVPSLREVVEGMRPVIEDERSRGTRMATLVRPLIGLARGVPGARGWRRTLSEGASAPRAGPELIDAALRALPDEVLDARDVPGSPPRGRRDVPPHASGTTSIASPRSTRHAAAAEPSRTATSTVPHEPT